MENQQNHNNYNNMGGNDDFQQSNTQGTTRETGYTSYGNGNMRPIIQRNVALCIIFSIITCGIYLLYWMYKAGGKVDKIKGNQNGNSGVLYIVLAFLGFSIISFAIMQDTINKNAVR